MKDDDQDAVYSYVGMRLKSLRRERGETQADVARVIGISPQQYQKYEDGSSRCSLPKLLSLADHFGVSADDIIPVGDPGGGVPSHPAAADAPDPGRIDDADLMARLVSSFVSLSDPVLRLRLVETIEAIARTAGH